MMVTLGWELEVQQTAVVVHTTLTLTQHTISSAGFSPSPGEGLLLLFNIQVAQWSDTNYRLTVKTMKSNHCVLVQRQFGILAGTFRLSLHSASSGDPVAETDGSAANGDEGGQDGESPRDGK